MCSKLKIQYCMWLSSANCVYLVQLIVFQTDQFQKPEFAMHRYVLLCMCVPACAGVFFLVCYNFVYIMRTGYQTAYSQLAFAGKKEHDPLGSDVPDPKLNLAKHLGKLATGNPGKVRLVQFAWNCPVFGWYPTFAYPSSPHPHPLKRKKKKERLFLTNSLNHWNSLSTHMSNICVISHVRRASWSEGQSTVCPSCLVKTVVSLSVTLTLAGVTRSA